MAVYTLQRGLVVKIGQRHFEHKRELDNNKIQLEDVQTGAIRTIPATTLVKQITAGEITVVRSAEPSTSDVQGNDSKWIAVVIDKMDEKNRTLYLKKIAYVRFMRKRGIRRGQRKLIELAIPQVASILVDPSPPSASAVMRWIRRFEKYNLQPVALASGHMLRSSPRRLDGQLLGCIRDQLKTLYFKKGGRSIRQVVRRVLQIQAIRVANGDIQEHEAHVSEATVRRIADEVSPYDRDRLRYGNTYAAAKWRHSIGGIYATRPLERVEMDHTLLDLYVIDDRRCIPLGRPTVTILIDSYSGYILSIYVSFESETLGRMMRAIKIAIQPKDSLIGGLGLSNGWHSAGLWEVLVVDNGLAFHSTHLHRLALELCCDLEYCPTRKPWFKPTVERAMLEMARILPYAGRPQKPSMIDKPYDPKITACVMFSDLCNCLYKWVVDVHPFQVNERKLARPIDLYLEGLDSMPPPSFLDDCRSLDIIAGITKDLTVRNGGVEMQYINYRSPELGEMAKGIAPSFKTSVKFDPNDLGQIYVQHPTSKDWLCVPAQHEDYASGLNLSQHKLIRSNAKADLLKKDAYVTLMRAQAELQDMWDAAISSGKKLKRSAKQLAILEGLNSLTPIAVAKPGEYIKPEKIVTLDDGAAITREVPDFIAFDLEVL